MVLPGRRLYEMRFTARQNTRYRVARTRVAHRPNVRSDNRQNTSERQRFHPNRYRRNQGRTQALPDRSRVRQRFAGDRSDRPRRLASRAGKQKHG